MKFEQRFEVVVTDRGQPVPFAMIAWQPPWHSGFPSYIRADANGHAFVPDHGGIWANDAGVPQDDELNLPYTEKHSHQWTFFESDPENAQPALVELHQGMSATLTVTDDLGQPLRNQRIFLTGQRVDRRSLKTDDMGVLEFDHLSISPFTLAWMYGHGNCYDDRAQIEPPDIPATVEFFRRVTVRGVVHLDGKPVSQFSVEGETFRNVDGHFQVRASPLCSVSIIGDFETTYLRPNVQPGAEIDLGIIEVKQKASANSPASSH